MSKLLSDAEVAAIKERQAGARIGAKVSAAADIDALLAHIEAMQSRLEDSRTAPNELYKYTENDIQSVRALWKGCRQAIKEMQQREKRLVEALSSIDATARKWEANRLGSVSMQRTRWERLAAIARAALAAVKEGSDA